MKAAAALLALLAVPEAAYLGGYLLSDELEPAPGCAVLVMGFPARADGSPHPVQRLRMETAVSAFVKGGCSRLVISGGAARNRVVEAEAMASLVEGRVPKDAIVLERAARNTAENVLNSLPFLETAPAIFLVSDSLHVHRAKRLLCRFRPLLCLKARAVSTYRPLELYWLKWPGMLNEAWARVREPFFAMPPRRAGKPLTGVLEGFYGKPWSWRQRNEFVSWMGRHGLTLFVMAPKDELSMRARWREPFSSRELAALADLCRIAKRSGVEIAWTLSPLEARYADQTEVEAAAAKLRAAAATGASRLALAFDDMPQDAAQFQFANRVLQALERSGAPRDMTFIPARYWGDASPYFDRLARELDARYRVAWSGPAVISRSIGASDLDRFRQATRHSVVLGDNYPVQDRLADSGPLFLGPLRNRDPRLLDAVDAYVLNLSPSPDAGKIAALSLAAFAQAPGDYRPELVLESAARRLASGDEADALLLLARYNSASWLDPFEDAPIQASMRQFWSTGERRPLERELDRLDGLDRRLPSFPALWPWARKLSAQAQAAKLALRLDCAKSHPALASEFERAWERSESSPALVGHFAFERFFARAAACERAQPPDFESLHRRARVFLETGAQKEELDGDLKRLAALGGLGLGARPEWIRELVPWLGVFSGQARRALRTLDGHRAPSFLARLRSWRYRLAFLPAFACRSLLLELSDEKSAAAPVRRPSRGLRLWLALARVFKPRSFAARLDASIARYRATGEAADLLELLSFMETVPRSLRVEGAANVPVELLPWAQLVADFGRLGKLAVAAQAGGRLELLRARVESANGLVSCLELKLLLDALAERPSRAKNGPFSVDLPDNPAELI